MEVWRYGGIEVWRYGGMEGIDKKTIICYQELHSYLIEYE